MTARAKSDCGRGAAQMRIRIPHALREEVRKSAVADRRHMNTQVVALIECGLKAKGPAEAATSPSRGSINSGKEIEMNSTNDSTQRSVLPSPTAGGEAMPADASTQPHKTRPTDKEIASACDGLLGDVYFLRQAARVLNEYANSEFKAGRFAADGIFSCRLGDEQVSGIQYMLMHVRDLTEKLETGFEEAFRLKGGAQ